VTLSKEQIEEMERLLEKATPGPWTIDEYGDIVHYGPYGDAALFPQGASDEDQKLVAAARSFVPEAIREIKELRAQIARLEEEAKEMRDFIEAVQKKGFTGALAQIFAENLLGRIDARRKHE
jgi:hypothetical protein